MKDKNQLDQYLQMQINANKIHKNINIICYIFAQSPSSYSFHVPKSISFISLFISISFISQVIVHLIQIHYIWLYSYCIKFQPPCLFHLSTNYIPGNYECLQIKFLSEIYIASFEAKLQLYYYSLLLYKNHNMMKIGLT